MKLFPILAAIGIIHPAVASLLTTEQRQLLSCVNNVLRRHFAAGRSLLLSLPAVQDDASQESKLTQIGSDTNDADLVDSILMNTHYASHWPIYVSVASEMPLETTFLGQEKISYYVIILWPGPTDKEIIDNLLEQFDSFQNIESWNRRALFFVMLTGTTQAPKHLALKIFDKLWKTENILNIILLVPAYEESQLYDNETNMGNLMGFDLYTWFPYHSGYCAGVEEVTLLDRWVFTDNGHFSKQVPLFPHKIPTNLHACPLRVSALGSEPYVFLNDKQNNDNYKYRGLEVEYLLIISHVMNTTLVYLPLAAGTNVEQRTLMLLKLSFGQSDVLLGALPLHLGILLHADATISYLETAFQWLVPCPTPVPKIEKVLGIFTPPVWFTLMMVHIMTTVTVWCIGNRQCSREEEESPVYKTVFSCLHSVWAVSMGVSVAEQPRTSRLRVFFLLFMWYCFAINTIFQAFFTTFLVEPGFHKQIATFDELLDSGITYGSEETIEAALNIMLYYEYKRLKSPRLECLDHDACLERLITKRDITMISLSFQANYIAFKLIPNSEKGKYVCSLDQDIHKMSFVMYMQLGSPLLDRFNTIIRRTHEAGLVDNYWTMLKWETRVKSMGNSTHGGNVVDSNSYFALSLSHMMVGFCVLLTGYILSLLAFIGELLYT
jgi:hypothetical protein